MYHLLRACCVHSAVNSELAATNMAGPSLGTSWRRGAQFCGRFLPGLRHEYLTRHQPSGREGGREGMREGGREGGLARRPDSAPLAGPALSPPAPREWHRPSGRISHEWRERLAQCRNMCTQLGPSLIITESRKGTPLRRRGAASTHIHLPHEATPPYIQHTWNSVKPPLFLNPTAASCSH
jgi:hypothetical protein